jgi:hypothetical protein
MANTSLLLFSIYLTLPQNQLTDEQKEQFKPLLDARANDALHRAKTPHWNV